MPADVRPAESLDLAAVERIYLHYVHTGVATFELSAPDEREWRRRFDTIAEVGLPFLVAESAGEFLGYAYATQWRARPAYRYTVEESVYVAPGAAGAGVGRALLDELLHRCAKAGVREVIAVVVDSDAQASLALHRRCRFAEAGRLRDVGYKHGRWLDTLLLQRSLEP
ncbi:MAG: GNAT family N-acetyltransferase [Pseudonocardiaceae bacterium]|nr:GNAT family N-acetyltransferase [Pseudonocardiaceae bacterium]